MSDKFFNEMWTPGILGEFFKPLHSSFIHWKERDPVGIVEINCAGLNKDDLSLEVDEEYLVLDRAGISINIPTSGYDLDTVEAVYSNGLLTLTIQKLKSIPTNSRKIIIK